MEKRIITSGKRKTAIARATIKEGSGKVIINKVPYANLQYLDKLRIDEALRIAENVLGKINFDANIVVRGGGERGQVEAARLALAKGILKFSGDKKELQEAYSIYDRNLLIADVRRKEACKPGDSKARSKRQSSKR